MKAARFRGTTATAFLTILLIGDQSRISQAAPPSAGTAKWTVMIYMNGKNDLEEYAKVNYNQIRNVGSTGDVNVVVELGLLSWAHTYRILATPAATVAAAGPAAIPGVVDLGKVDMGSRKALSRFVAETKRDYPASRYLLVIWDHGQGWRLERLGLTTSGKKPPDSTLANRGSRTQISLPGGRAARVSNYRSISYDSEFGKFLYNRDVQELLESEPVDIIGFDACLMGMVETAHSLRLGADWMIGSEELSAPDGWRYDEWLASLTTCPDLEPKEVCRVIGDTYLKAYQGKYAVTLSAVDLRRMRTEQLVEAISRFADRLIELVDGDGLAIIKAARADCAEYAPGFNRPGGWPQYQHIDLVRFCQQVVAESDGKDRKLKRLANAVIKEVRRAVALRWCENERCDGDPIGKRWGSHGLAIYFPTSRQVLDGDEQDPQIGRGYEIDNSSHPVEFVQDRSIHWASFLHFFANKVPR
jgi:Clostripain family